MIPAMNPSYLTLLFQYTNQFGIIFVGRSGSNYTPHTTIPEVLRTIICVYTMTNTILGLTHDAGP